MNITFGYNSGYKSEVFSLCKNLQVEIGLAIKLSIEWIPTLLMADQVANVAYIIYFIC